MYKKLTYFATRPSLDVPWQFQTQTNYALNALMGSHPDINATIMDADQLTYKVIIEFATEQAVEDFTTVWNSVGADLEGYNEQHGITTHTIEE